MHREGVGRGSEREEKEGGRKEKGWEKEEKREKHATLFLSTIVLPFPFCIS